MSNTKAGAVMKNHYADSKETGEILEIENISVYFDDKKVVSDVSLTLNKNEIFGLVGETQSGKSILARTLIDFVPFPGKIHGDIKFKGKSIFSLDDEEKRQLRGGKIALIGTNPKALLNPLERIGEQIANVMVSHQYIKKEHAKKEAIELLHKVGIINPKERSRAYPHELSGGMAQRVVIALALISNPEIILADDATLGLDATVQVQVLDLLTSMCREMGMSVILITHDLGIVANYCDRVGIMYKGEIVEVATKESFFEQPEHEYSRELLAAAEGSLLKRHRKVLVKENEGSGKTDEKANTVKASALDSKRDTEISSQKKKDEKVALLEVENLYKYFYTGKNEVVKAVDGVSFNCYKGETLALVGESGSGKTTIGQLIVRLLMHDAGTIRFEGMEISNMNDRTFRKIRQKIQMIFQESYVSLNPRWVVGELIAEPLNLISNMGEGEKKDRVQELLKMVHLDPNIASLYPYKLTAGEQKRVGIARGLATNPDFVIFDECTTSLDVRVRAAILDLIMELQEKIGITSLFITHDLNSVRHVAHRVAVMCKGLIIETGKTEEIFKNPIEVYTKLLLSAELPIENARKD